MILDVFREKVIDRILNRNEDQSVKGIDFQNIKRIACLVDLEQFSEVEIIAKIKKELNIPAVEIRVLGYTVKQLTDNNGKFPVFCQKEIGKLGKIKTPAVQEFIAAEYDLLINYFTDNKFPLLLVSGSVSANLRVGFSSVDQRCNDVLINCETQKADMFFKELKTYLKVITK